MSSTVSRLRARALQNSTIRDAGAAERAKIEREIMAPVLEQAHRDSFIQARPHLKEALDREEERKIQLKVQQRIKEEAEYWKRMGTETTEPKYDSDDEPRRDHRLEFALKDPHTQLRNLEYELQVQTANLKRKDAKIAALKEQLETERANLEKEKAAFESRFERGLAKHTESARSEILLLKSELSMFRTFEPETDDKIPSYTRHYGMDDCKEVVTPECFKTNIWIILRGHFSANLPYPDSRSAHCSWIIDNFGNFYIISVGGQHGCVQLMTTHLTFTNVKWVVGQTPDSRHPVPECGQPDYMVPLSDEIIDLIKKRVDRFGGIYGGLNYFPHITMGPSKFFSQLLGLDAFKFAAKQAIELCRKHE